MMENFFRDNLHDMSNSVVSGKNRKKNMVFQINPKNINEEIKLGFFTHCSFFLQNHSSN